MKPFLRLIFLIVLLMFLILEHVSAGCIPFPPNVSAFCISGTREPNAPLSFSGSAFDPDRIVTGSTPAWQWDFDYQGTFVCDYQSTTCGESNQESFCAASHVYAQPGVYVVAVKYFDDDGLPNIYTFSVQVGTTRLYYLKDHLGTIRMTVDQNAHLVSYDDYDPWGMQLPGRCANIGDGDPKYKFTGKERDVETGYDYFGARYYDALIGRWLSVDPDEERYPELNPYGYAADNPLKFNDPDGRGLTRVRTPAKPNQVLDAEVTQIGAEGRGSWASLKNGQIISGCRKFDAAVEDAILLPFILFGSLDPYGTASFVMPLEAVGEVAAAKAAQLAKNVEKGEEYESAVLEEIGFEKNHKAMPATDPQTGVSGKTIPDAVRENGQTVEIKNRNEVSNSAQLRKQQAISTESGQKAQLIVPSRTKVSKQVMTTMDVHRIDTK